MLKVITLATLGALAATGAAAQAVGTQFWPPDLSGLYRCVHGCRSDRLGHITARGWDLILMRETGEVSKAWIDRPGHIWVPALNEGAVYSPDGFTIQFDRGSVWVLVEPEPIPGSAGY